MTKCNSIKKHVLFLIHDLGGGGAEKVLITLVNNLNQEKYDITVCALFGGGINEQFLKPHIHHYNVWSKSIAGNSHLMKLLTPKQLHRLCIKKHYDIEVSFLEGPCARIISGCEDKDTRLVSWIHVEQHTIQNVSGAFRNYREAVRCYRCFDRIVCVSGYVKKDFCSLIPVDSAEVIYNAIDTDMIRKAGQEEVANDLFKKEEFKIVGVGKIMNNKGFDRLARIHNRLINKGLPVHCYILGTGPERSSIESYVKEKQLSESFTFLGYQTNPYRYVSKCNLFVCASFAEGFSTAATEALVLGTPVCTVEVSGMKEMLGEKNEYGVITDNDEDSLCEGIMRLVNDTELLEYYKKRAYERGHFFDLNYAVSAVEKLLVSL